MHGHNRHGSWTSTVKDHLTNEQRSKSKTRPQALRDKSPPIGLRSPLRAQKENVINSLKPVREERRLRSKSPVSKSPITKSPELSPSNARGAGKFLTVDQKFRELRDKRKDLTEESEKFAQKIASVKRKVREETKNLQSMRRQRSVKQTKNPAPLLSKVAKVLIQAKIRLTTWAFAKTEEFSQLVARRMIKADTYRAKRLQGLILTAWRGQTTAEDSDIGSAICARKHYQLQLLVKALESWRRASQTIKGCVAERSVLDEIDNLLQTFEANQLDQSFGADDLPLKRAPVPVTQDTCDSSFDSIFQGNAPPKLEKQKTEVLSYRQETSVYRQAVPSYKHADPITKQEVLAYRQEVPSLKLKVTFK